MSSPSHPARRRCHIARRNCRRKFLKSIRTALLSGFVSILAGCSTEKTPAPADSRIFEAWDVLNQPSRFGRQFETRYESLPRSGRLATIPWSDYYWPTQRAGIAYRWLNPGSPPFGYSLLSQQALRTMSGEEISKLSPAEKLDIFMGRFDFPTVKSERRRTYPGAAAWEGLCHGWAPAALYFVEPKPVSVNSVDGIKINFGSADIKALLGWHTALHNPVGAVGLGGRCNLSGSIGMSTSACRDSNAGAFHVVLSNMLGRFKEGFIIDIARAAEVWNQPVYGFRSRELSRQGPSPGAAIGTKQEIIVESEVYYTTETEPQWNALGQLTERPSVATALYRYRIEVDSAGVIRGGEWLQDARPDFLWMQQHGGFSATYKAIEKIYEASIR
ncbi:MAG: hypothetical protein RL189_624 [Pseudomonadota bacterium]|jgi:hypothetical protein